jgi:hypothetical protein
MADDLAAGGPPRGGVGVGGEMMLAGKPADVADLAEKPGRQHRPHAEQLDQGGVGLGDGGLDARLHDGDLLLQVADVCDQVSSQLVTDDRRCTSGRDRGQQGGGALGGEVASGAAWDQVDQQPVEPVDGLGASGDQVLAPLAKQVQHGCLILDTHLLQPSSVAGGDGDSDRVGGVALAAVSD